MTKTRPRLITRTLIIILSINAITHVMAQNCDVDFPGVAIVNYSSACGGPSVSNITLGKSIYMGDGDVFTFDAPSAISSNNLVVDVDNGGKIVVPAGVTLTVGGNFTLKPKNSGCTSANPCTFTIEVYGTLIVSGNFVNELVNVVWSGPGIVMVDSNFDVKGCMICGTNGCPSFQVIASKCKNDAGCPEGDFCEKITGCAIDIISPVISGCPSNITVTATASCQAVATWTAPTFTDNCSSATMTSSHTPGSTFSTGTTLVTYTATDLAGNKATCTFSVIVQDATKPVISGCPSVINATANSSCQAIATWTAPTFTDNCGGATMTSTHTPGSTFNIGITAVTYTATDAAGNKSTCTFNVNVQDTTRPVISRCPSNVTVTADASCQAVATWAAPTFTDNCSTPTMTSTHTPGSLFNLGTTPVIYTITETAGNASACTFNVIVLDATKPVISGCPSNITVTANASCQAVATWTAPGFTDNCSSATMTSTHASGSTFNTGITPVTYTATDAAGNTSTCTFHVIVQDATKPVISGCPSNITLTANASCQAVATWTAPTFTDNCTGATMTSTHTPGSTFNLGTTPVTYTATDAAGNTSTCTFNVVVQDATKPVISGCPSDITLTSNASCQAVATWTAPTFTDNCSGATMTSTHSPGSSFNAGTTPVTYTATDAAGNTSTCTFHVIVQDATKPVISGCPSNITLTANASCQAVATWTAPTFTDNCSGAAMTSTHTPGSTFNLGTTPVTYTATDAAGNTSTCTFHVIVQDANKPVISGCPSDITLTANASCQAVATWTAPSFPDNCSSVTMTSTHIPGSTFNIGTTPVTYTATDAAGNTSTCTFNVIVQDVNKPAISGCPSNIVLTADASCQAVATWTSPTFTDDCTRATMTSTHTPGSTFQFGTTTVTYTATDASGNAISCSFDVTVTVEAIPEIINCPEDIVIEIFSGESTPVNWEAPVASGGCEPVELISNYKPTDKFRIGETTVSYTATTPSGTLSCSFNVTVIFKGILVHEIVTPNGDGENDTWIIKNIENFADNSVIVFDRWGGVVYRAQGYDSHTTAWAGANVPAGTYFYALVINANNSKIEYKGFVELVK